MKRKHIEDHCQALQCLRATLQTLNSQYERLDTLRDVIEDEMDEMQSVIYKLMDKQKQAINLLQASNDDTF